MPPKLGGGSRGFHQGLTREVLQSLLSRKDSKAGTTDPVDGSRLQSLCVFL